MSAIATIHLDSPLILAPLAGYSDLPFRLLCREFGAGLCFSEMISCHGLVYRQKKTLQMLASDCAERPVSFQLFGADIQTMAEAADILNEFSPDLVDINMGCPVKKVTKKGAGAALMSTPRLAENIITEVVKNSTSPVTVKFRLGVNATSISCIDFAKMAEQCGVAAVTVHGRTWAQGFTGTADWERIRLVKKSIAIPVIGNGDILCFTDAQQRLQSTGCDAVMIGRGALGNPWVFSSEGRPASLKKILSGVLRHLELIQLHLDVDLLLSVIKNHIGRYFRNLPGSSTLRGKIYDSRSFSEMQNILKDLITTDFPEK
jgi:tRNA-dihydrouridine synthase B